MHAGFGPVRGSQSVGSMVSRLDPGRPLHFVTGTSGPCTSVFKPVWLDAGLPDLGPAPTGQFDPDTLFWRHEALHRAALRDYPGWAELIPDRERLEAGLRAEALACTHETPAARADLSAASFARAGAAEADWLTRLGRRDSRRRLTWHYSLAWRGFDRQAQMPSV